MIRSPRASPSSFRHAKLPLIPGGITKRDPARRRVAFSHTPWGDVLQEGAQPAHGRLGGRREGEKGGGGGGRAGDEEDPVQPIPVNRLLGGVSLGAPTEQGRHPVPEGALRREISHRQSQGGQGGTGDAGGGRDRKSVV